MKFVNSALAIALLQPASVSAKLNAPPSQNIDLKRFGAYLKRVRKLQNGILPSIGDGTLIAGAQDAVGGAVDAIVNTTSGVVSTVTDTVGGATNGTILPDFSIEGAVNATQDFASGAADAIGGAFNATQDFIPGLPFDLNGTDGFNPFEGGIPEGMNFTLNGTDGFNPFDILGGLFDLNGTDGFNLNGTEGFNPFGGFNGTEGFNPFEGGLGLEIPEGMNFTTGGFSTPPCPESCDPRICVGYEGDDIAEPFIDACNAGTLKECSGGIEQTCAMFCTEGADSSLATALGLPASDIELICAQCSLLDCCDGVNTFETCSADFPPELMAAFDSGTAETGATEAASDTGATEAASEPDDTTEEADDTDGDEDTEHDDEDGHDHDHDDHEDGDMDEDDGSSDEDDGSSANALVFSLGASILSFALMLNVC